MRFTPSYTEFIVHSVDFYEFIVYSADSSLPFSELARRGINLAPRDTVGVPGPDGLFLRESPQVSSSVGPLRGLLRNSSWPRASLKSKPLH